MLLLLQGISSNKHSFDFDNVEIVAKEGEYVKGINLEM